MTVSTLLVPYCSNYKPCTTRLRREPILCFQLNHISCDFRSSRSSSSVHEWNAVQYKRTQKKKHFNISHLSLPKAVFISVSAWRSTFIQIQVQQNHVFVSESAVRIIALQMYISQIPLPVCERGRVLEILECRMLARNQGSLTFSQPESGTKTSLPPPRWL